MAFIPEDAKWYLADIVQEFQIEDEASSLVWINLILIRADSPEEAYERSLEEGNSHNSTYLNTDGKRVSSVFRGLRNLYVIIDKLEHGSELIYEEKDDLNEEQVQKLLRSKSELSVFTPRDTSNDPL
ncbi:MAG: DUF4288 domain-containing protein [Chloroflexota bacterium]